MADAIDWMPEPPPPPAAPCAPWKPCVPPGPPCGPWNPCDPPEDPCDSLCADALCALQPDESLKPLEPARALWSSRTDLEPCAPAAPRRPSVAPLAAAARRSLLWHRFTCGSGCTGRTSPPQPQEHPLLQLDRRRLAIRDCPVRRGHPETPATPIVPWCSLDPSRPHQSVPGTPARPHQSVPGTPEHRWHPETPAIRQANLSRPGPP